MLAAAAGAGQAAPPVDHSTTSDVIVLDSEAPAGRRYLRQGWWAAAFLCAVSAAGGVVTWSLAPADAPGHGGGVVVWFCGFGFGGAVICLTAFQRIRRGTWRVTPEGVHYTSRDARRTSSLRWHEVDRLLWVPHYAALKGHGVTIALRWEMFDAELAKRARQEIERSLVPEFDLAEGPKWSFQPNRRSFLGWVAKAVTVVVVATAIVILPAWAVAVWGDGWETWSRLLVMLVPVVALLYALKQQRSHFDPWRPRAAAR
jgi:hypothetical protein